MVKIRLRRAEKKKLDAKPAKTAAEELAHGVVQEGGPFPAWWTSADKNAFMVRAAAYHVAREGRMKYVRELIDLWVHTKVTY